ncbi:MAG: rhodanese-like domain-containing protein [Caldilineaceae bacterium]|nr:rhodanese-like domain-containing protein [Caldilineaceae bacterium]MCB0123624.1 rhodanese-like domain-containing protein [Caldilineaceae bacterium]
MRIIQRKELKTKLDRGDDFKLIMTLNEWAFRTKHIPGSIHLTSQAQAAALLHPNDEIIVYCTNPACSASIIAYEALRAQGFANIARYAGGIEDWEAAGYPLAGDTIENGLNKSPMET